MADHGTLTLDDAARAALAENFVAVTASTTDAALFFLESHNWNLDSALQSFFDTDEEVIAASPPVHPVDADAPVIPPPNAFLPPAGAAAGGRGAAGAAVGGRGAGKKASGSEGSGSGRPVIRTLADLSNAGSDSEDDDEDGPAEYYTGGEKSGMLVQDPSKGNNNVDAIFDRAREMGAMDGPVDPHSSSSSRSFTGTGRLLSGETVTPAPQPPADVIHTITFWTNGFTVNDGPLRRFDDPENAPFLESIGKSECPKELEPADRRTMVNVNLVRKDQKYTEPVKPRAAFQGVGRTLAGGSASGSANVQPTVTPTAPVRASAPAIGLSVDASLPSTSLQLRLADGTRMVARFNTHHTIADIRAFIDASRPGASRTYQLQTVGFPPKPIADLTQTIEQAGLANSVIVQRL